MKIAPLKILLIGQTPPPYHGQSIMINEILSIESESIVIKHLRMNYSEKIKEVGVFKIRKLLKLFKLILKIAYSLIAYEIDIIYYPPAGIGLIPIWRDIVTLLVLRIFKKKLVFHFHAYGLTHSFQSMNPIMQKLFKIAFFKVDLALVLAESGRADITFMTPKKIEVIPHGINDEKFVGTRREEMFTILFVGNLIPSKGVFILLDAVFLLWKKGFKLQVDFVGGIPSNMDEDKLQGHDAVKNGLAFLHGVKIGIEKKRFFERANIFCFPSYYENENLPVVIIEAMKFGLPILAGNWRGIPSMVEDGENGLLVEPGSKSDFVQKLEYLLMNRYLMEDMGKKSRIIFEKRYTSKKYKKNILNAFLSLGKYEQRNK